MALQKPALKSKTAPNASAATATEMTTTARGIPYSLHKNRRAGTSTF